MKKILKYIYNLLISILSSGIVRYINLRWKAVRNSVYSGVIAKSLKNSKSAQFFEYPLVMIGNKYIEIDEHFSTRARLRLEAWDSYQGQTFSPAIKIGKNVHINYDCHIGAINRIEIGDNVLIGSRVLITDHNHGEATRESIVLAPVLRPLYSKGPVIIGDNVWIGEGAAILPNVRIGENAIIGANSVVSSDVAANSVVGGVPAKLIKMM
ncbi:acetyltransferase-like isoleucine patch superfamily enzyme [Pedobacter sp. CAN_A7]|uniref:acyltransferase n=1 Tax=Pedobacter sp. CAN_A7 TaxID=2787722 RepID=UPI001A208742